MASELFNHLWQSTLFAGAAGLLVLALRNNRAQVRYWLWLIASLKFLVPFSVIVAVGSLLAPTTAVPAASAGFSDVVTEIGQPFVAPSVSFAAVHPSTNPVPEILLAFWLCGFLVVAFRSCARWRRVRATVRAARPLPLEIGVRVLSSPALLEPGIFGIFQPTLLLPEGITDHLTREQLNAILAHELCHVRRRDNLFAALHMAVEAIFWFHPLVWWIGARLVEERERACDEEVLRLGNSPEIYAESILKTCRFYLESPLACMSGVTGADLKKRVVRIMMEHAGAKLGRGRKLLLASFATAAIAGPLAFGFMSAPQSPAQSTTAEPSGTKPKFEVASIKRNNSGRGNVSFNMTPGGRFHTNNVTLNLLIQMAYQVKDSQLTGGPKWIRSNHYDIEAKPDDSFAKRFGRLSPEQRQKQIGLMLQSLLADRFQLRLRHTTKTLPMYALLVAKNGPKLQASEASGGSHRHQGLRMMGMGNLEMNDAPLSALADMLSHTLGRIVVDETHLKGNYRIKLHWTPDVSQSRRFPGAPEKGNTAIGGAPPPPMEPPPPPESSGPSIFTAIREQLGLKLKAEKGPVEVLVIEHVERPSAN